MLPQNGLADGKFLAWQQRWMCLSPVLNEVSQSLGEPPLYPFVISQRVAPKTPPRPPLRPSLGWSGEVEGEDRFALSQLPFATNKKKTVSRVAISEIGTVARCASWAAMPATTSNHRSILLFRRFRPIELKPLAQVEQRNTREVVLGWQPWRGKPAQLTANVIGRCVYGQLSDSSAPHRLQCRDVLAV